MLQGEEPLRGRSASVREPTTRSPASAGGPVQKPTAPSTSDAETEARNKQRDAKRRTVQLEYVAPKDATARGEASPPAAPAAPISSGRTRARGDTSGPVEVPQSSKAEPQSTTTDVPMSSQAMPPPVRPGRDQIRAASDNPAMFSSPPPVTSASRPATGGSLGAGRLPSRGNSYSQPAVPTPTNPNAQAQFSQPKSSSGYIISTPIQSSEQTPVDSRPPSQQNLALYQQQQAQQQAQRGHKRSSTLGSIGDRILGRSSSRSRRVSQQQDSPNVLEKRDKRYPPVSMRNAIPNENQEIQPRTSTESSRRTSFGFSRKNSEAPSENKRSSRRFSFLPASFSMNNFAGNKKDPSNTQSYQQQDPSRPESKGMAFGRGASRSPSRSTTNSTIPLYYDVDREGARNQRQPNLPPSRDARYEKSPLAQSGGATYSTPPPVQRKQYRDDGYGGNLLDQQPEDRYYTPPVDQNQMEQQSSPAQYNSTTGGSYIQQSYGAPPPPSAGGYSTNAYSQTGSVQSPRQQIRQSNNRKFEHDHGHGGSSGATRRVMEFFRRRGKDRSEV